MPDQVRHDGGRDATLLIDYLDGSNLQHIALNPDPDHLEQAIRCLLETVRDVWLGTRQDGEVRPRFLREIEVRLDDIFAVHPRFNEQRKQIGGMLVSSYADLLRRNRSLDDDLAAPFSVYGHGDFNLDNVIYDPAQGRIHFVDLHRSEPMDYVRDVAVFMVSAFRLPVFEPDIRDRLDQLIASFFEFASAFAERQQDRTFEARLALGLARSFATSTRFELDRAFAAEMARRSLYLLACVDRHRGSPWDSFRLRRPVIFY